MMTGITWTGTCSATTSSCNWRECGWTDRISSAAPRFRSARTPARWSWAAGAAWWSGCQTSITKTPRRTARPRPGVQKQAVVPRAVARDRCRDRSLDRRPEDGRPAAERPPVRHPHRVRTEPAAGHFNLARRRVRNIRVRPLPPAELPLSRNNTKSPPTALRGRKRNKLVNFVSGRNNPRHKVHQLLIATWATTRPAASGNGLPLRSSQPFSG